VASTGAGRAEDTGSPGTPRVTEDDIVGWPSLETIAKQTAHLIRADAKTD